MAICVRDTDLVTKDQREQVSEKITHVFSQFTNLVFIQFHSLLMKEQQRLQNFSATDGVSFENNFQDAVDTIKSEIINLEIPVKLQFSSKQVQEISKLIYPDQELTLEKDQALIDSLIDGINKILNRELKLLDAGNIEDPKAQLISDSILYYCSKYYKKQKYQNEVN